MACGGRPSVHSHVSFRSFDVGCSCHFEGLGPHPPCLADWRATGCEWWQFADTSWELIKNATILPSQTDWNNNVLNILTFVILTTYSLTKSYTVTVVSEHRVRSSWPSSLHSCFVFWRFRIQKLARRPAVPTDVFCGVPQSLQANAGVVSQTGHGRLLSHHFQFILH
jgi:hypothetical protein